MLFKDREMFVFLTSVEQCFLLLLPSCTLSCSTFIFQLLSCIYLFFPLPKTPLFLGKTFTAIYCTFKECSLLQGQVWALKLDSDIWNCFHLYLLRRDQNDHLKFFSRTYSLLSPLMLKTNHCNFITCFRLAFSFTQKGLNSLHLLQSGPMQST